MITYLHARWKTTCLLLAFSFLMALAALFPMQALAEVTSVSTATATANYRHPNTGAIEDSGGESSEVLGQSMVDGVCEGNALVEVDETGTTYVTLRFGLYDYLSDVTFSYDADGEGTTYVDTEMTLMQTDGEENTGDYRFAVESVDSIIRVSLYPEPMGRDVVFYVTLSDLEDGNTVGFVETVVPGQEIESDSIPVATVAAVVVIIVIVVALVLYFAWYRPRRSRGEGGAGESGMEAVGPGADSADGSGMELDGPDAASAGASDGAPSDGPEKG